MLGVSRRSREGSLHQTANGSSKYMAQLAFLVALSVILERTSPIMAQSVRVQIPAYVPRVHYMRQDWLAAQVPSAEATSYDALVGKDFWLEQRSRSSFVNGIATRNRRRRSRAEAHL